MKPCLFYLFPFAGSFCSGWWWSVATFWFCCCEYGWLKPSPPSHNSFSSTAAYYCFSIYIPSGTFWPWISCEFGKSNSNISSLVHNKIDFMLYQKNQFWSFILHFHLFWAFWHCHFYCKCLTPLPVPFSKVGLLDEEKILPLGKDITAVGMCSFKNGVPEIKSCKDLPYFL